MKRYTLLMMPIFASFLVAAGCQTVPGVTSPCDALVNIETKAETNAYLVENDRSAATGLARHKARFVQYDCK